MAEISVIEGLSKASLNKLVHDLMKITGITNPKELIRSIRAHEWTLTHVITRTSEFLAFGGTFDVSVIEAENPKNFFSENKEIIIDQKLLGLFISGGSCCDTAISVSKYKLKKEKQTLDRDILMELPEGSTFDIDTFWQVVIGLIKKWLGNKNGELEENVSNVLYVWDASRGKRHSVQVSVTSPNEVRISLYGIRETSGWGEGDVVLVPS